MTLGMYSREKRVNMSLEQLYCDVFFLELSNNVKQPSWSKHNVKLTLRKLPIVYKQADRCMKDLRLNSFLHSTKLLFDKHPHE